MVATNNRKNWNNDTFQNENTLKNLNENDPSTFLQNARGISSTLKVNTGVWGLPACCRLGLIQK